LHHVIVRARNARPIACDLFATGSAFEVSIGADGNEAATADAFQPDRVRHYLNPI
jgi:hypothetical protein